MARLADPDVRLLRALRSAAGDGGTPLASGALTASAGLRAVGDLEARLGALRAAGYRIDGDAGRGWRLVSAPASLIADDVLASLPVAPERIIGREVLVFEETDSTNDLAARAGEDLLPEGLVIFAEKQRAGRGRLGRVWESPPRRGLWLSMLLRPVAVPVERWPELTFCAALAVAETAERHTGAAARIKWPNDVLINGRKIAGILLECHHRQSPGFVVVGIGVNILHAEEDFEPLLRQRAGSLAMMISAGSIPLIERRSVAASLLENMERHYARWPEDFASIMQACERRGCTVPGDTGVALPLSS